MALSSSLKHTKKKFVKNFKTIIKSIKKKSVKTYKFFNKLLNNFVDKYLCYNILYFISTIFQFIKSL